MTAQAAETGILSEAVVYAASFSNGRLTALHPAHRTRLLLQPALLKTRFPPPPHANHIRSNAQKHATGGQT